MIDPDLAFIISEKNKTQNKPRDETFLETSLFGSGQPKATKAKPIMRRLTNTYSHLKYTR